MTESTPAAPAPVADNAASPPAQQQTTAQPLQSTTWRDTLPDDLKANASLNKFTEVNALAASYVNLERMLGLEKVPRPRGEFDPSNPDWAMFLDAAGRPKDAAEYKFEEAKLPEGMTYDGGLEEKARAAFHAAGLNAKQAQMMRDWYVANQTEMFQSSTVEANNAREEGHAALRRELGTAYDAYIRASGVAQDQFMTPELFKAVKDVGLDQHPDWHRVFGKIGKSLLGEEKLKQAGVTDMGTPEEAMAAIRVYQSQHGKAIYDKSHPEHSKHSQELARMFDRAFPGVQG